MRYVSKGTYRETATGQQAYGSMYDYFAEESFGKLKVQGKMMPWVTVSKNRDEYTQGTNGGAMNRTLLPEAIEALLSRDGRNALGCVLMRLFLSMPVHASIRIAAAFTGRTKSTTAVTQRRVSYVMIPEVVQRAAARGSGRGPGRGDAAAAGGGGGGGPARMMDISVLCHETGARARAARLVCAARRIPRFGGPGCGV